MGGSRPPLPCMGGSRPPFPLVPLVPLGSLVHLVPLDLVGSLGRPSGGLVGVLLRLRHVRLRLLLVRVLRHGRVRGHRRHPRHRPARGIHHRQRRARRPGRRFLGGRRPRVHRDGELDRAAEFPGERVDDKRPEPGFQLLLHEGVRGRDQHGILDQAERPGELRLKPGELARPNVHLGEPLKGSCPYLPPDPIRSPMRSPRLAALPERGHVNHRPQLVVHRSVHKVCTCAVPRFSGPRVGCLLSRVGLRTLIFHSLRGRRRMRCGNRKCSTW